MIRPRARQVLRAHGALRAPRTARRLGAAGLLVGLTACAQDYPQNTLAPVGEVAQRQAGLFKFTFWIAAVIFVLVEGVIVVAMVRFREKRRQGVPAQIHGNTPLEIAWTAIPSVLLLFVAVPTVATIWALARDPGPSALQVRVIGHQWWWEYQYPQHDVVTANELVVPTGRPVTLTLESVDVIHSFWMPRIAGKQDVIPGRKNPLIFTIDEPGTYSGQCAEFCGLSHANMKLRVVAVDRGGFDRWIADQKRPATLQASGPAADGARLFTEKGCMGCHAINGIQNAVGTIGPNLTHLQSRETFAGSMFPMGRDTLREWLADPPARKPGSKMPDLDLTDDEIQKLVAFLETLR